MELNHLSSQIIKAAIKVHKELGPGLLESVCQTCMVIFTSNQKAPWFVDKLQRGLAQRWHRKDYKHSAAGGLSVILILSPLKESGQKDYLCGSVSSVRDNNH